MNRMRTRAAWIGVLLSMTLLLGGCTKHVSERCSGSNNNNSCSASFKESDGKWTTDLEGGAGHSTIVINGTFSIESGSGTLTLWGSDMSMEYDLVPGEPVVVEDLTLELIEVSGSGNETRAILETNTDEALEGFSAEYTFSTE